MKIFVKSRGNLRNQDYIYWLACNAPAWQAKLDHPEFDRYLELLDTSAPGLLVFTEGNTYHLLLIGLSSSRKEPSSPGYIRNTLLLAEIQSEKTARALASYTLQYWERLAQIVDAAIQTDSDPNSLCGYHPNCLKLFNAIEQILNGNHTGLGLGGRSFKAKKLPYGGVGSDEWLMLAGELQQVELPAAKPPLCLYVVVTKRAYFDKAHLTTKTYLLCDWIQEPSLKKN